jgi:hypothetical protein
MLVDIVVDVIAILKLQQVLINFLLQNSCSDSGAMKKLRTSAVQLTECLDLMASRIAGESSRLS